METSIKIDTDIYKDEIMRDNYGRFDDEGEENK
jgi:hypothetical protein